MIEEFSKFTRCSCSNNRDLGSSVVGGLSSSVVGGLGSSVVGGLSTNVVGGLSTKVTNDHVLSEDDRSFNDTASMLAAR